MSLRQSLLDNVLHPRGSNSRLLHLVPVPEVGLDAHHHLPEPRIGVPR